MTRLLRSEIQRLLSRRLVWVSLLVSVGLAVALVAFVIAQSKPDGVGDDVLRTTQLWLTRSAAASLGVQRDNVLPTISVLTYLLIVVIGASAVGAEYRAGTVTTILTWEPRRIRLLVMRLVAAALVGMVFFLVLHAVFIGGWVLGAALRGSTDGADADFWRELLGTLARATLVAGVLAVLSGALATLGRNTAAAMGIWFGYLIAIEAILRGQISEAIPWFLTPNIAAFYAWEPVRQNGHVVSAGLGTWRLALYVLVVGGAAVAVFRRRDVT